uniref:Uncharacterized protein n=1 Tax=Anguilla anguilla TaxID=7936 RepID=A0A0E9W2M2_ANGAN
MPNHDCRPLLLPSLPVLVGQLVDLLKCV